MGKADELKARYGSNVSESISLRTGAAVPTDGVSLGKSGRQVGVDRAKDAALISIDRIIYDPDQPRKTIDPEAMAEMVSSFEQHGQLTPIRVRWVEQEQRHMILVGERRFRAAQKLGWQSIACVMDDREMTSARRKCLQLVENAIRQDVPPIEQARTMQEIMAEENINQLELAARLSMSPARVTKCLAMLKLPPEIQDKVESGAIQPNTAYSLVKIEDPEVQREAADRIVSQKLSRPEAEEMIRQEVQAKPRAKGRGAKAPAKKLAKTWIHKASGGTMRLTVDARKGIEPEALVTFLRQALAAAEAALIERSDRAA